MMDLELLPVVIPPFPENLGSSHPFSRGESPGYYRPEDLKDRAEGKTARTDFFEKLLVGLYWKLRRPVPYAFTTRDGQVRSLDAGCLKFLLNRKVPELTLIVGEEGFVTHVVPADVLCSRFERMRSSLESLYGVAELWEELPFDIDSPIDERRKVLSVQIAREGAKQFRLDVLNNWESTCAVTGSRLNLVLEAAHIHPYLGPKTNDVRNGVPLRRDVHRLFDLFYLTIRDVAGSLFVECSPRLADTEYGSLHGKLIDRGSALKAPDTRCIHWHLNQFAIKQSSISR